MPFTIFNHIIVYAFFQICQVARTFGHAGDDNDFSVSAVWGIYVVNVGMAVVWLAGGPFLMALTAAILIFNQNFYNSLLFRRSFEDFGLSLVFGNFLTVQLTVEDAPVFNEEATDVSSELSLEVGRVDKGNSICASEERKSQLSAPKSSSKEEPAAEKTTPCVFLSSDSLFEGLDDSQPSPEDEIMRKREISRTKDNDFILTVNQGSETVSDTLTEFTDAFDKSQASPQLSYSTNRDPLLEKSPLNPLDVYFEYETHSGTTAWRNTILEATQKFPGSQYSHRKHNWVIRNLEGSDFYTKDSSSWQKVNSVEVKRRCKDFYEKQVHLHGEITNIKNGLKDLKKNHGDDNKKRQGSQDTASTDSSKRQQVGPSDHTRSSVAETRDAGDTKQGQNSPRRKGRLPVFSRIFRQKGKQASLSQKITPKEHRSHRSERKKEREVYLGLDDNQGYQHFVKVVRLAAEDNDTDKYTDDVHDWIIPRVNASDFYMKTNFGTYREAKSDEVKDFAEKCYANEREQTRKVNVFVEDLGSQPSQPFDCNTHKSDKSGEPSQPFDCRKYNSDKSEAQSEPFDCKKPTEESFKKKKDDQSTIDRDESSTRSDSQLDVQCVTSIDECMQGIGKILKDLAEGGSSKDESEVSGRMESSEEATEDVRDKADESGGCGASSRANLVRARENSAHNASTNPMRGEDDVEQKGQRKVEKSTHPKNRKLSPSDYSGEWRQDTSHFLETNQDTESVEKFIGDQTKSRRSGSTFFAGLWNRAKHGGEKKSSKAIEPMPPAMADGEIEESIVAKEMTCPEKKAGSSSQYVMDSGTPDMESRDDESDGESDASHGKEPGIYGRLMSILEEDYLFDKKDGSTGSRAEDDYSFSDEMESEFTGLESQYLYWKDNYSKADHRGRKRPIQPSNLFEYITKKMEEEHCACGTNGLYQVASQDIRSVHANQIREIISEAYSSSDDDEDERAKAVQSRPHPSSMRRDMFIY
jgi:hypothetical protein